MKLKISFYNRINAFFLTFINNRVYFVFHRYRHVESFNNSEGALIEEAFALHFAEPFKK